MLRLLLLTIILECLALLALGERNPLLYLYWVAVTTLTNLTMNLILGLIAFEHLLVYWIVVILFEIAVFASEFYLCYLYTNDRAKSIKYSAVCNSTSLIIGLLIQIIF